MSALFHQIWLQFKLDFRNKGALLTYYLVPLVFFGFMGGIFTAIDPLAKETLISAMTVFGVSMGGLLGLSVMVCESLQKPLRKAYLVGGIPLWSVVFSHMASAFVHLLITTFVMVAVAPLAFDAAWPSHLLPFAVGLVAVLVTTICVGALLGLFFDTASKTSLIGQLVFLPSLMLSGIMFPTSLLPDILGKVGALFPATWGFRLMTSDSWSGLGALALIGAVALAGIFFKLRGIDGE